MDPFDLRKWPGFVTAGGNTSRQAVVDQIVIDSRQVETPFSLFVALEGHETDGHCFVPQASLAGAKYAVVRKDYIPPSPLENTFLLKVDNPVHALQEIAKAYRNELSLKLIAITGSYGKTMVKDLLQEMLKTTYKTAASPESFNSQIGVPLSLLTLSKTDEMGIIEAAISKKNEMDRLVNMLNPDFGMMTQIGSKHLDTLGNLSTLTQELCKLFTMSPSLQWILLPNTHHLEHLSNKTSAKLCFWNIADPTLPHARRLENGHTLSIPFQISFPNFDPYHGTITSGFHYYLDLINITVKAAWKLKVSPHAICETLDKYVLEPMRAEIWKSPLGITFLNDTYSQDPQSVDKALKFLDQMTGQGRKIFLFGGLRGTHSSADYKRVGHFLVKHKVSYLHLIGAHPFDPLIQILAKESPSTSILKSNTYAEALEIFKTSMHPEDQVLIKGERKEPLEKLTHIFHESLCTNLCLINLAAIEHNIKAIKKKLPESTRIMTMVKALAYGTDDFRMAKFLKTCGIDILGVSYADEGVSLKRLGVSQDIFVLNAAEYEIGKIVKWDLEVGVSHLNFIRRLAQEAASSNKKIKVHLHIDTGMSRFGCRPEEAITLAKEIKRLPSLYLEGIMTHFASADKPEDDSFTLHQAKLFEKVIHDLEKEGHNICWKHAANSSAALRFSFPAFNMVRIGLAVYGLYPSTAVQKACELKLAVSLISRVVGINHCKKGETISYGRTHKVEKQNEKIAVLPIGYFDGLHRNYSGRSHVVIRGQKAVMVGKICMDFMMVDVTDIADVSIGDPVLIFGEDEYGDYLSPENLAHQGDSIIHELITCLGPRIQRVFIYEESDHRRSDE